MEVSIEGGKSFSYLKTTLKPQETIVTESGAMASMDSGIDLKARLNGGFFRALILKFLGKESIFLNFFTNKDKAPRTIHITQRTPGEVIRQEISGDTVYLQPGAFIACTEGVSFSLRWAGLSSWLAKEGLFRLKLEGQGSVWYGSFGAVMEREVNGEYILDTGHLLSYPPDMKLQIKMSGGIFSSIFGGEGLVLKLSGKGKIKIQTRSLEGLAGWLNPRFWR